MQEFSAAFLLFLGITLPSTSLLAQQADSFPTLLRGTPVPLQLDEALHSRNARMGQQVAFQVTEDVTVRGRVIIPSGSAAMGTVAQVLHRGWIGRADRVDVNIDVVRLPGGQIVPLSVTPNREDNGRGTMDDSIVASFSPGGNPGGAGRRHRSLIAEGTTLHAFVRRDTIIVPQRASASN